MDAYDTEDLTPTRSVEERLAEIDELVADGMSEVMAEKLRAKIRSPAPAETTPAPAAPNPPVAKEKAKSKAKGKPTPKKIPASDLELGSENEVAQRYLKSREHPVVFDRGKLWKYSPEKGIWVATRKSQSPYGYALTCDGKWAGTRALKVGHRFAAHVEAIVQRSVEEERFFAEAPIACVFTDGAVVLLDGELQFVGHSPDHRAIHTVGIPYHGDNSRPTLWLEALDTWLGHFGSEKQAYIDLIQEFVGACLFGRGMAYGKTLMLRGPGGDGKSQCAAAIRELFPYDLRSSVKPSSLREQGNGGDDKRAHLAYARINIASDCDKAEFDLSGFKAVTGGDEIHCRALREKGFSAVPTAGWLITLNAAFQIGETGRSVRDRILIIDFLGGRIRDTERDVKDYGMVIARSERALIIRWALEGFDRLLKRGNYAVPASCTQAVDAWIAANNTVGQFAESLLTAISGTTVQNQWTARTTIYKAYRAWCEDNGHKSLSSGKLYAALLECFNLPATLIDCKNKQGNHVLPFKRKALTDPVG